MQIIGIGRNFIRGGVECNIHCDRSDLHYMTDCMNINELSRVKYWGGGGLAASSSYAYADMEAKMSCAQTTSLNKGICKPCTK